MTQTPGSLPYGVAISPKRTNRLALAALITALLVPPVGIVLGVAAGRQVRRTGQAGAGLAVAGVVVGIVLTVLWAVVTIPFFIFLVGETAPAAPPR
jgi:tellurite resistance protein TehA-like permease